MTSAAGQDYQKYDDAIGLIRAKWKDHKEVSTLAGQMEALGKNMAILSGSKDTETRKKARIVWQKAAAQYWDLVWAIVEAKIDAGPPDDLEFDPAERLFIDFGHLNSHYTTPNEAFFDELAKPSAVDMYQYNRLTDYIKESYALIFSKPYTGPSGGVSLEEKLTRFSGELEMAKKRRRMAMGTLFSKIDLVDRSELDEMLDDLEQGLQDAIESDMRTKRIREADQSARKAIHENCRKYETAERTLWFLMDKLEKKLSGAEEKKPEEPVATVVEPEAEAPKRDPLADFDPFAVIGDVPVAAKAASVRIEPAAEEEELQEEETEATAESLREREKDVEGEAVDQSLKIVQNVMSLHDRTKFLAGLIVHVTNEAERWKTRTRMAENKYKGQGTPALKMELREGLNHKKDFMMLAARTGRVDTSPLCQNKSTPISFKRAGEIMMDLTPLDPDMLRASRIRMYGIPRVILVPGQGLGVYDWEDNSLIIPIFDVTSDVKDFCFALASFRWDNDEDRTLKDTYALLKQNKGKGIRALQEAFMNDYFLWISKERKGYRILPKDVSKWFKTFFKQKSGVTSDNKPQSKR